MRQKSESLKPATVFGRPGNQPRPAQGISPGLFYGLFTALALTNALTLVGFLMAPDISRLLGGQTELVVSAYEDRIAQLRLEVDRLQSRHFAQAGDINLQLQELTQQQEMLLEQQQYVRQLAQKAEELGLETAAEPDEAAVAAAPSPVLPSSGTAGDVASIAGSVRSMLDDSRAALALISNRATEATDAIVDELSSLGIRPRLPAEGEAVGGPWLPPEAGQPSETMVDDANAVYEALARFKAARGAIDLAPVHRPLGVSARVSSGFGNRTDPFTRGRAFHAGIDFPAPTGTVVLSAGAGRVSYVGQKSGYGNVVEVTHASGLVTRYGHLSAFLVREGQAVNTGTPIANVGSTGRSTGPHLHFEVRRGDQAIDPAKYLAAGKRLQRFLAS